MELRKLSNRIVYLPSEESTDRPVLGYVKGDRFALAVDAGTSSGHVQKFYRELEDAGLPLPDFTVITHWHWDHTFGMHSVSGATIACRTTNEKLGDVRKWEWTDAAMKHRLRTGEDIVMCDTCIRLEYADLQAITVVKADIGFTGRLDVDLGNIRCEICEIVSPHSRDSVVVYIPEEKVVFIGDADSGDYYENSGEYEEGKLHALIRTLDSLDADTVISGHGEPEDKRAVIHYLNEVLDGLQGCS